MSFVRKTLITPFKELKQWALQTFAPTSHSHTAESISGLNGVMRENSSSNTGSAFYRKFSDGMIIQGGRIAPSSANHAYTNFPTPFDNGVNCVICTINNNTTGGAKTRVVYNVTKYGFNHNGMWGEDGSQADAFYWLAIGY